MELTEEQIDRLAQNYSGKDYKEPQYVEEESISLTGLVEDGVTSLDDWIKTLTEFRGEHKGLEITIGKDEDGDLVCTASRPETAEETAERIHWIKKGAIADYKRIKNNYLRLRTEIENFPLTSDN